jgi:hypothetical protein
LAPSDYHLFLGLEKTIASSPLFFRCGGHLLPRRPSWTDNILNFFLVA